MAVDVALLGRRPRIGSPGHGAFAPGACRAIQETVEQSRYLSRPSHAGKPKGETAARQHLLWNQRLELKLIRAEAETLMKDGEAKERDQGLNFRSKASRGV